MNHSPAVLLRLGAPAIAGVLLGLGLYLIVGIYLPSEFVQTPFQAFGNAIGQNAIYWAAVPCVSGGWRTLMAVYHYHQWMNGEIPSCPRCGDFMEERSGRFGWFWGCHRYPRCRGTRHL